MKLAVIACKVLIEELRYLIPSSGNQIDIFPIEQSLHEVPEKLNRILKKTIDEIENQSTCYHAILLAYGLCGGGIAGIKPKKYNLVVPRCHDCITLLLGSRKKYNELINNEKGIYWYTRGWIDLTPMPGKERHELLLKEYIKKYGEENAHFLMEIEKAWLEKYCCAARVFWKELDYPRYRSFTLECAKYIGWGMMEVEGSPVLLKKLLSGDWNEDDFLVASPGQTIQPSYDENILRLEGSN